ncbi:MAG: hypothetical protein V4617_11485 [Gemmatimonadota bacterium]
MMSSPFTDPRVRMRDALRYLVGDDAGWQASSLQVFRNRLLDHTGSDARPLAELLLEAHRRGWHARIGDAPMSTPRWDALVAPFIMQWSAERFVQPDMARWAVECWGYAFGVIDATQLRIAPPPAVPTPGGTAALASALIAKASHDHAGRWPSGTRRPASSASPASPPLLPATPTSPARSRYPGALPATRAPAAGAASAGAASRGAVVAATRGRTSHAAPYAGARAAQLPPGSVWIVRVLMTLLVFMATGVVVSVVVSGGATRESGAQTTRQTAGLATLPGTTAPATAARRSRAGVPSITTSTLTETQANRGSVMYVEPARRADGTTRPMITASPGLAVPLDEARMVDGSVMRGRVEVIRAGTVIFRDVTTGLRHEISKDVLSEIITEFGTSVRFNSTARTGVATTDARAITSVPIAGAIVPGTAVARENGVRVRGVAGRYLITYAQARAVGSSECTRVWQRAPNAVDEATVVHTAGADTATILFEGGDSFPSNIDGEGRFASTFRIVPDQARSSTALTTRVSGQFLPDGALSMQVNIVYFQRMRVGTDVTCNVTVDARGARQNGRG